MSQSEILRATAINLVGFEFFQIALKNGFTPDQAKAEMLKAENQKLMLNRINEILK